MTDIFIIVITLTITIIIIIMIAIKSGKLGWVEVGSLGVLANKHCSTFSCCTRHHCNQPSSSLSLFLRLWSRHFTLKLTPTITPNDKCLKKQSLKRPEKNDIQAVEENFTTKSKLDIFGTPYTHTYVCIAIINWCSSSDPLWDQAADPHRTRRAA